MQYKGKKGKKGKKKGKKGKKGKKREKRKKKCSSYFNNELTSLRSVIVPKQLITQAYGLRSLAKW